MSTKKVSASVSFRTLNPNRYRVIQLRWYYKNRKQIGLMFSKPQSEEIEREKLKDKKSQSKVKNLPPNWLQLYITHVLERMSP